MLGSVATLVVTGTGFVIRRIAITRPVTKFKARRLSKEQIVDATSVESSPSDPIASQRTTLNTPTRIDIESDDRGWKVALTGPLLLFLLVALIVAAILYWRPKTNSKPSAKKPDTVPPIVVIVNVLHTQMDLGLDAPRFTVERHGNAEVIRGRRGAYYRIDLKDAQARRLVFFQPGKYLKDEFGEEFRSALAAFRKDVTAVLERGNVP